MTDIALSRRAPLAIYLSGSLRGIQGKQGDPATNLVTSVASRTGNILLTKVDVGLSNVDNTSDLAKPISTAVQTALNAKASVSSLAPVATTGAYSDLTGLPTITTAINRVVQVLSSPTTAGSSAKTDYVYYVTAAGTHTMPTAIGNTNRYSWVNNYSANITIDTTSSQTINGSTSISLIPNQSVDLISNNSNWSIF